MESNGRGRGVAIVTTDSMALRIEKKSMEIYEEVRGCFTAVVR